MKEEKDIAPIDFAESLRKSGASEDSKVYWNETYCYICKSKWDVQYLEKSLSHWLLVKLDYQSFLLEPLLGLCFIKG